MGIEPVLYVEDVVSNWPCYSENKFFYHNPKSNLVLEIVDRRLKFDKETLTNPNDFKKGAGLRG